MDWYWANVRSSNRSVHVTADGRRLLVLHGDQFDAVVQYSRFVALAGSWAYDMLINANRYVNWVRRRFNWPYWSLAASVKYRVKNAVNFISDFEAAVATHTRREGADGVVCGHIHHAEIRDIDGVTYHNCGDWVESCTALVEQPGGEIELIRWAEAAGTPQAALPAAA